MGMQRKEVITQREIERRLAWKSVLRSVTNRRKPKLTAQAIAEKMSEALGLGMVTKDMVSHWIAFGNAKKRDVRIPPHQQVVEELVRALELVGAWGGVESSQQLAEKQALLNGLYGAEASDGTTPVVHVALHSGGFRLPDTMRSLGKELEGLRKFRDELDRQIADSEALLSALVPFQFNLMYNIGGSHCRLL